MLNFLYKRYKAIWRFRKYKPQPVTSKSIGRWLSQYSATDREILIDLLLHARFIDEQETSRLLVERNDALLEKLSKAGISRDKVIYVQFDDAGSSSGLMLNLLKEGALLERSGCKFVDSNNVKGISEKTRQIGEGAIIYVDDFVGTGNQFCKSRDYASQFYQGTFTEFLLSACICEEAIYQLGKRGIEGCAGFLHSINDRVLHSYCNTLTPEKKDRLLELGKEINAKWSLGYNNLATMVVFYRNTPNTVPLLLRGSVQQDPYHGVIPRTTDLPVPPAP